MWTIMLILSYLLFLIFIGAFIVCVLTGTRMLEKKSDAVAAYLVGAIAYGILTVIIFNLEPHIPIVTAETKVNSSPSNISIKKESVQGETQVQGENNINDDKNGLIIGDTDSKIYHVPGSTYYQKELKKKSNNEYFKTVEEAENAGYRAPKK